MTFDEFKADFEKINKKLMIVLTISIILSTVAITLMMIKKHSFIFTSGATFKEKELNEYVCKEGLKSIFTDEVSSALVTKGIRDLLEKNSFKLEVKDYLLIKRSEKNKCRVIIKTDKVARSFIVTHKSDDHYPFYFKINQIDEIEHKEGLL